MKVSRMSEKTDEEQANLPITYLQTYKISSKTYTEKRGSQKSWKDSGKESRLRSLYRVQSETSRDSAECTVPWKDRHADHRNRGKNAETAPHPYHTWGKSATRVHGRGRLLHKGCWGTWGPRVQTWQTSSTPHPTPHTQINSEKSVSYSQLEDRNVLWDKKKKKKKGEYL